MRFRGCLLVLYLTAFGVLPSHSQLTTGTISGLVKDSTGAVLPGATLTILNEDTGISRTIRSDGVGRYSAPSLSLGQYRVAATLEGFQSEVRSGIVLTVGREAIVNFQLSVGAVAESVEVTGEAPLVNTTTSSMGELVGAAQVEGLPLNGRSIDQLAILQPAVSFTRYRASGTYRGQNEKLTVQGARPSQNIFLLDGTDINDSRNRTPGSVGGRLMGVEGLREFRIETSSYSAEFASAGGGVIVMASKSGTNVFHGSVYEYLRNDNLDARNFFDGKQKPEFERNQFGFSFGGPLRRDRTFFFGNLEALRERLGTTNTAVVPNELTRQGFLPNASGGLDPVGVDPQVRPYLDFYPAPNSREFGDGTAESISTVSNPTDEIFYSIRGDHNLSDRHSAFVRYTLSDGDRLIFGAIPWLPTSFDSTNQYLTIEEKAVISPVILNTVRFGFTRSFALQDRSRLRDIPSSLDFVPGSPVFTQSDLRVSSMTNIGDSRTPIDFVTNKFLFSDDVVYVKGGHTIKIGGAFQRHQYNLLYDAFRGGEYTIGSLRDFLHASTAPASGTTLRLEISPIPRDRGWRQNLIAGYLQDDVRIKNSLTANLGLRYETMTAPGEVNGRVANLDHLFDPAERLGGSLFENKMKLQFAPRVGLAWDVFGHGRTAVRAGFGFFYNNITPDEYYGAGADQPPFSKVSTIRSAPFPNGLQDVLARGTVDTESRPITITGPSYIMQRNFSVEQQLAGGLVITAGYVGSTAIRLIRSVNENDAIPVILADGRKFFPTSSVRRRADRGNVRRQISDANSFYNAFTFSAKKGFGERFQLQGSYTFSRSVSDAEAIEGGDTGGEVFQALDAYDRKLDRGLSSMDIRHKLNINYTYGLPSPSGGTVARTLLGGWQLGGIASISSGGPFVVKFSRGVNWSNNQTTGSSSVDRPNLVAGRSNNPVLGGPDRYFDASAFEPGPRGFYGNLARNAVLGPGLVNFDLSLQKNTSLPGISESAEIQFKAEFFNAFNHPNFGVPLGDVFNAQGQPIQSAGRISDTATTGRQIQLGVKLVF